MILNMTAKGIDVNLSFDEPDNFDDSAVLAAVNQLLDALAGAANVDITITSEADFEDDADTDDEYSEDSDSEEDADESDEDAEDTEDSDVDDNDETEEDNH